MSKGTIVVHHTKGYGFIQAEGFPGNVFVTPVMMSSFARLIDMDNLVGRPVNFESTEIEHNGKVQIQATALSPITTKISDEELVNEILTALRPVVVKIVEVCRK